MIFSKIIYKIPLLGWMLKEAAEGPAGTKVLFIVNCVGLWALAIAWVGFPAIILPALAAVSMMFAVIIRLTWGDFAG